MIGSVVVHGLLGWLLLHGDREGTPDAPARTPAAITLVEPVEIVLLPNAAPGPPGGAAAGAAPATSAIAERASSPAAPPPSHARAAPARSRRLDPDPRGTITIDDGRDLEHTAIERGNDLGTDHRVTATATATATRTATATGSGSGSGSGSGTGNGIGFGDGGSIQRPQLLAPPPAPRGDPPSKARPARLIYPTRQRDVEDAELFIARLIIDDDGFVDGAKLIRGFGGRRDEVAARMIWQFRYAPALDAGGRPVRSTLDQRFLVGP